MHPKNTPSIARQNAYAVARLIIALIAVCAMVGALQDSVSR